MQATSSDSVERAGTVQCKYHMYWLRMFVKIYDLQPIFSILLRAWVLST